MNTLEHVVITGAGGAIGSAIARAMRTAWPHTRLTLVDHDAGPMNALCTELGAQARAHVFDLRDVGAIEELVASIERGHDGTAIDGLVNCAGIMHVQQLAAWKWQDAQALLAVDLLAPLQLQQLVVPGMVERGNGLVVNIASMAARVPLKGGAYYCASKAGLAMASEIARAELAERGIRVVTVYPGPVKSALEQAGRDGYGGGGFVGKIAPTGDPAELATKIMHAIDRDEPRVIYPRVYGVGWSAPNLSSWLSLSYGPPPVS